MSKWSLDEAIEYYRGQEAAHNQEALVALLREVQEENGGVLPEASVAEIAERLGLKESFIGAIIKRYPSLRTESAPHMLEVCGGPNCARNNSAALLKFISSEYDVVSGGISRRGKFSYKIGNCMKQCGKGPNIKWDGKIYNGATKELLQKLIGK